MSECQTIDNKCSSFCGQTMPAKVNTVNGKRFAGLNFRNFHSFNSTVKVFP